LDVKALRRSTKNKNLSGASFLLVHGEMILPGCLKGIVQFNCRPDRGADDGFFFGVGMYPYLFPIAFYALNGHIWHNQSVIAGIMINFERIAEGVNQVLVVGFSWLSYGLHGQHFIWFYQPYIKPDNKRSFFQWIDVFVISRGLPNITIKEEKSSL